MRSLMNDHATSGMPCSCSSPKRPGIRGLKPQCCTAGQSYHVHSNGESVSAPRLAADPIHRLEKESLDRRIIGLSGEAEQSAGRSFSFMYEGGPL